MEMIETKQEQMAKEAVEFGGVNCPASGAHENGFHFLARMVHWSTGCPAARKALLKMLRRLACPRRGKEVEERPIGGERSKLYRAPYAVMPVAKARRGHAFPAQRDDCGKGFIAAPNRGRALHLKREPGFGPIGAFEIDYEVVERLAKTGLLDRDADNLAIVDSGGLSGK